MRQRRVPAASGRGTLTVGSGERSYVLHVPEVGSGPLPLVLAMHGYTLNATEHGDHRVIRGRRSRGLCRRIPGRPRRADELECRNLLLV